MITKNLSFWYSIDTLVTSWKTPRRNFLVHHLCLSKPNFVIYGWLPHLERFSSSPCFISVAISEGPLTHSHWHVLIWFFRRVILNAILCLPCKLWASFVTRKGCLYLIVILLWLEKGACNVSWKNIGEFWCGNFKCDSSNLRASFARRKWLWDFAVAEAKRMQCQLKCAFCLFPPMVVRVVLLLTSVRFGSPAKHYFKVTIFKVVRSRRKGTVRFTGSLPVWCETALKTRC